MHVKFLRALDNRSCTTKQLAGPVIVLRLMRSRELYTAEHRRTSVDHVMDCREF